MKPGPRSPETSERELFDGFDHFLERHVRLLADAGIPRSGNGPLADLLVDGLVVKLLRLADALGALARGGQGRESGPTARTLLTIYVNLKFLATYEPRDEAAAAYVVHAEQTLADLKTRVVREDKAGEAFPIMTEEGWDSDRRALDAQRERIEREKIPIMKKFRPPDARGKPQEPLLRSWTGMSDKELFDHVAETDGYRFYGFHSNELHGNVSGVGDVFTEITRRQPEIRNFDDSQVGGSLTLGAKYVILAMETIDGYHKLGKADLIEAISQEFLETVVRHRSEWTKLHPPEPRTT
jgi:hypothetical protein